MVIDWETGRWLVGIVIAAIVAVLIKRLVTQGDVRLEHTEHITRIDVPNTDLAVIHLRTGIPVPDPHLVDLVIKNRGPGNLKAADVAPGNLTVSMGGARAVAVAGVWVDGDSLPYDSGAINANWLTYPPVNIKKKQRATVRVICSGRPEIRWHENLPDAKLISGKNRAKYSPKPIPGLAVAIASLAGAVLGYQLAAEEHWAWWFLTALCLYAAWQGISYWWRTN